MGGVEIAPTFRGSILCYLGAPHLHIYKVKMAKALVELVYILTRDRPPWRLICSACACFLKWKAMVGTARKDEPEVPVERPRCSSTMSDESVIVQRTGLRCTATSIGVRGI